MNKLIAQIAEEHNFHAPLLAAVAEVESSGDGFGHYDGAPGHPKIRFEPHKFNKYCEPAMKMPYTNGGRGFSRLASETGFSAFLEAYRRDEASAILATSWGAFQIMGFHFRRLGYESPQAFRKAMYRIEGQYDAFARFIKASKVLSRCCANMSPDMQTFRTFAKSYNGASNVDVYSKRIARAYSEYAKEMA